MRWLIVLSFLCFSLGLACADEPSEWKEFASKEGRFKVLMPTTPKPDDLETQSDFGKGVLHMNSVVINKVFYAANFTDFPAEVKKVPLKQLYDSSRDGAVANLKGKLAKEADIKLGSYTGREIQIDIADAKLFRARVYLVDNRLYQIVVMGPKDAAISKEADKFLDSFKLAEK
jgi:hypothetical protein